MKVKMLAKGLNLWMGLVLCLSLLLVACGDNTSTTAPSQTTVAGSTTASATTAAGATSAAGGTTAAGATTAAAANSGPATDLNLWMLPLATQAGPPPSDWEA